MSNRLDEPSPARKHMRLARWAIVVVGVVLLVAAVAFRSNRETAEVQASLVILDPGNQDFARAEGPRGLDFPLDHGPHPDFQTEWWYYTGNLLTNEGRHFGYQLTFFRRAITPPAKVPERQSNWATSQAYLAHFALTDTSGKTFRSFERLARGAAGIAGASGEPLFEVWLEDWSVKQVGVNEYRLYANQDGIRVALEFSDLKGPVLQGDQGYSQKGLQAGNASYYYSQTRLASRGEVEIDGSVYPVQGFSWMDHEFSTSALSAGQVGWDWFALQLSNGSELMLFNIRQADGIADTFSSGALIASDGQLTRLSKADFQITVTGTWNSPRSEGVYPSGWNVQIPGEGVELEVIPVLVDQEHDLNFQYWEGAVELSGQVRGSEVQGYGYVELTGYADSMEGRF